MKDILKFLIYVSLLSSSLFANSGSINEYKTDLYYANGIMMKLSVDDSEVKWRKEIKKLFLNNKKDYESLANINMSYNNSENLAYDLYESYQQANNEEGWIEYNNYIPTYFENGIPDSVSIYRPDLYKQIQAYKNSIRLGHGVVVVAHSQGNYYTNEAYIALDYWMREYFHMISVASPSSYVSGGGPHVRFDNDIIKLVPTALGATHENPNPDHFSLVSYAAHDFYNSYMSAENTKTVITTFITSKIIEHQNADSQWEIEDGFRKLVEEFKRLQTQEEINQKMWEMIAYLERRDVQANANGFQESISEADVVFILRMFGAKKVTLKHKYDTSITAMQGVEVYPFNLNKKLYPVADNTGGNGWVMASNGGQKIIYKNDAYIINNFQEEWISNMNPFLALSTTTVCFNNDGYEVSSNNESIILYSDLSYESLDIYEDTYDDFATLISTLPSLRQEEDSSIIFFHHCPSSMVLVPFDGYKFFTSPGMDAHQNDHLRSFANKLNSAFFANRYLITF